MTTDSSLTGGTSNTASGELSVVVGGARKVAIKSLQDILNDWSKK